MKEMKATALIVVLGLAAAAAAVTTPGKYSPRGAEVGGVYSLPRFDNAKLLRAEDNSHGGYQFGHVVDVEITMEDGVWTDRPDGTSVWKLTIRSPTALSLGVTFDRFRLPESGELYVHNEATVRGAFTWRNNRAHGRQGIWPLRGNAITIEYIQPTDSDEMPELSIFKVTHGYKTLAFGSSGRCNNNVICPEADAWRDQIRGVAMMLTEFGSRYCSGSMINNARGDGRQLFLTANHCTGGDMYSDQLMFNYESSVCEVENQRDGPTDMTVSGLIDLAAYAASDYALFEVEEEIPSAWNVYLSGFSAENVAPVTMVGIHHPSGDIKKITFSNETGVPAAWSEFPNKYHWEVPHWDDGTTEPGSSGSPLFNAEGYIIGQLHGGVASCTNIGYDSYGAVWASWDQGTEKLATFLDPDNTGIRVVRGIDLAKARKN